MRSGVGGPLLFLPMMRWIVKKSECQSAYCIQCSCCSCAVFETLIFYLDLHCLDARILVFCIPFLLSLLGTTRCT